MPAAAVQDRNVDAGAVCRLSASSALLHGGEAKIRHFTITRTWLWPTVSSALLMTVRACAVGCSCKDYMCAMLALQARAAAPSLTRAVLHR